jgi:hypothetical protein
MAGADSMRSSRVVLVVLVVATLVATPARATSQSSGPETGTEADRICQQVPGSEPAVTAVTAAPGEELASSDVRFYPGTELYVVFCNEQRSADDTDLWSRQGSSGVTWVRTERWYAVLRLTGERSSVDLGSLVEQARTGPTLTVTYGARVQSRLFDQPRTILFRNSTLANRYNRTETSYVGALETIHQRANRLNQTAGTVRTGQLDRTTLANANETLTALRRGTGDVRHWEQNASTLLYRNVRAGIPGQRTSLIAFSLIDRKERQTTRRVEQAVQTYYRALGERRSAIASAIRTKVLLGLVVGLVVGALAGAIRPHRAGKEVNHYRDYSSSETYDRSVLVLPLGVAVVALVLGLGLALFGGAGVLEVLLP